MSNQIKSKERVANHGEVFTNEREVKAMCDLVSQECERIESRFLEPACGDGNFLTEVLRRKLDVVKKRYGKSHFDYEQYSVLAMTSIYGVDIMADNVKECRQRLFEQWNKEYKAFCKKDCNEETRKAVQFILEKNILCGNALSLMCVDENQMDIPEQPIIFAEWSPMASSVMSSWGGLLKRRDFRLDVLLRENPDDENYEENLTLFSGSAMSYENWMIDPETNEPMPKPVHEYPLTHYRRINENV